MAENYFEVPPLPLFSFSSHVAAKGEEGFSFDPTKASFLPLPPLLYRFDCESGEAEEAPLKNAAGGGRGGGGGREGENTPFLGQCRFSPLPPSQ